jgi:hypothetical protein
MSSAQVPTVPREVAASTLLDGGLGFAVYADLPDAWMRSRLLDEAQEAYRQAARQELGEDDAAEGRGGTPHRRLLTAGAGPVQDEMYRAPWLAEALSSAAGVRLLPSGGRGSYSYYARPGDHLGLHRDIETCDLATITVLYDNSSPREQGGALLLYPGRTGEPLSAIRRRPRDGACVVKVAPGQTIAMWGGIVPHAVLPVAPGQVRIVSVLCFKAVA